MPVIRPSKEQADEIAAVCSLGSETLSEIASIIEALPVTVRAEKIRAAISAKVGTAKAEALERVLLVFSVAIRRRFDNVPTLLDSVLLPTEWNDAQRQKWRECRPALERLLSIESVILTTKATDLSFDIERLCIASRIITDVRPVFDLERNKVIGTTIRQTLRLEYSSSNGDVESISIGLDADDIVRLKKSCEEAIHKAEILKNMLEKAGLTEMLIPGDES
jgi:hypothetical protein